MIIPEDTPETPKAQARARELVEDSEIPASSPPAYPGHESGSYQAGTSSTQPLYIPAPLEPVSHTEPAGKRFFKAFGVALLIWFLLVSFTGSVTEVGRSTGRTLRLPILSQEHRDAATAWPTPSDGKLLVCFKGPLPWHTTSSSTPRVILEIPRQSDALYLFSRGIATAGNVKIIQDEKAHGEDVVLVDIEARGRTAEWLHVLAVCSLERKSGERGIGIFTPTRWPSGSHRPSFEFDVTIRLPKLSSESPLRVKSLETSLSNFEQHVADLAGSVNFDSISLRSTNGHIFSRSVNATKGSFKTTNAHIRGKYESHGDLTLKTSNAEIVADVTLYNHDESVPSVLTLQSSNSKIDSTINLFSSSSLPGSYTLTSKTTNGPQTLTIPVLPPSSTLLLSANTTNSPAKVVLPDTYEGSYVVKTTNSRAVVMNRRGRDPMGRGRKNVQWETGVGPVREGGVRWEEEHLQSVPAARSGEGRVVVKTANAPATLIL
ncbi:hypothetical protein BC629DRAFT_433688 [Irpex lacteus]|nr:hypothetical protein BC629DRAFT_433688 [Irpex lacteus]